MDEVRPSREANSRVLRGNLAVSSVRRSATESRGASGCAPTVAFGPARKPRARVITRTYGVMRSPRSRCWPFRICRRGQSGGALQENSGQGGVEPRHRDFQSVQEEEQPIAPCPSPSQEGATEVRTDAGFANERQLGFELPQGVIGQEYGPCRGSASAWLALSVRVRQSTGNMGARWASEIPSAFFPERPTYQLTRLDGVSYLVSRATNSRGSR
jgi:hypothetical protein